MAVVLAVTLGVLGVYLLALNMQVSRFEDDVKALEQDPDSAVTPVTPIEHHELQRDGAGESTSLT